MTLRETEALRRTGFVEETEAAVSTLNNLIRHSYAPVPLALTWRQLATLQAWAADTEPQHSRSAALAELALQHALLAQQQRQRAVSFLWDCGETPPEGVRRARRFSQSQQEAQTQELQSAICASARLVHKLTELAVQQRRREAVEWPAS